MRKDTIKEKIFDAECLVDYLLLGEDWVANTIGAIQTAQGLTHDVERLAAWREKKRKEKEDKQQQQQQQKIDVRA